MNVYDFTREDFPLTVTTHTPEDTEAVGAALGRLLDADRSMPAYVAMYGDLGVGKTAFVRGVASVLAPGRAVRSPTFALVNEYRVAGRRPLFHFDMYRIEDDWGRLVIQTATWLPGFTPREMSERAKRSTSSRNSE